MVRVPVSATDDELLALVRTWLDALAAERYEFIFEQLGYAMAYGGGAAAIRRDIERYRSSRYFPGVERIRVSDWRTAVGGNPNPRALVRKYAFNPKLPIVATVEVDLPLNGRWSNLEADFVVTVKGPAEREGVLCLEDISAPGDSDA
jgi:hypothetical protein